MDRIRFMMVYGLALGPLAWLTGCESYAPQPLDSAAHRALWQARSVNVEDLREFAATLGKPVAAGAFALDDGVSLAEGEVLALAFNPDLRAARARAAIALAAFENAGRWEDPMLTIDVMKMVESMPEPWMIGGMVGFTIPISGRLGAEKAMASAEHELELRRIAESEWRVCTTLRASWAEWSAIVLQADLLRDLLEREAVILGVVDRLEAAQSLSRLEGRLFRMERASRQSELLLLESRERELELALRSEMGLTPVADITLEPGMASHAPTAIDDAFSSLEASNPSLAAKRAEYEVAERALNLEIRKQFPDLQIGPAYESDEGNNKVGFGLGIPLPLLNANRKGVAVASAQREAARIEYESLHERLVSAYAQVRSRFEAAVAAKELIERELLPLAQAQIDDEQRMAELGELNVLLTLESVVRAHETRVRLIEAALAEAQAATRLQELLGPDRHDSTTGNQR